MAATKPRKSTRRASSGRARSGRGASRDVRGTRKGKTEGRWIHHADAVALWRGLCTSCKGSLERLSRNVQQLVRDAGAGLERFRERAALPASLGAESSGDGHETSAPSHRAAGKKRAQRTKAAPSGSKTAAKSTKKKPAAKKQAAQTKSRTGSRKTTRAKTTAGRAGSQTTRRAAKARSANSQGKKRAGRKK